MKKRYKYVGWSTKHIRVTVGDYYYTLRWSPWSFERGLARWL